MMLRSTDLGVLLLLAAPSFVGCGSSSKPQSSTAGTAGTASVGTAGTSGAAGASSAAGTAAVGTAGASGGGGASGSASGGGGTGNGGASGGTAGALGGLTKCTPQCGALVCGSDGCDGVCGVCAASALCQTGACVAASGADVVVGTLDALNHIAPEIYGLAFASKAQLAELNVPLNRYGGNGSTRYNWQLDVHNTAGDYYFENNPDQGEGTFGASDYVSSADVFTRDSLASNAAVLTTIPTIGFTPSARKSDHPYDCGFPKTKYPAQSQYDAYDTNCGNGVDANMKNMQGDATDAMNTSKVVGPEFATARVQHIMSAFGATFGQRPHFYALDNEMMLWNNVHRDVHPMPVNYAEVWQKTLDYAPAIRTADPNAFIMGYGTWSATDVLEADVSGESKTYGAPLVAWYLQQLAQYEKDHSVRLVDCIDLHFYPQQDSSVDSQVLNSPRTLWDPDYVEESWLQYAYPDQHVQLLPRVRAWIQANYPGTDICVSEYNFFPSNPLGVLVEAEVLGTYGREGVRLAAYWTTPWNGTTKLSPYWAFRMYRNYDGASGTFGDVALSAATTTAGLSVFAAKRSTDGAVTVMLINQDTAPKTLALDLHDSSATTLATYSYTVGAADISHGPDASKADASFSVSVPARTVELLVTQP
jgi:hypothetical protein